ncbi:MAG: hypothetical protein K9L70_07950 [Thiohalocapsa sp.]|nr:hypothetical protein [Thiohalocapsa sp.]MCF7991574.1 hypothetical protein [Thiohalocapsa sp.]
MAEFTIVPAPADLPVVSVLEKSGSISEAHIVAFRVNYGAGNPEPVFWPQPPRGGRLAVPNAKGGFTVNGRHFSTLEQAVREG